MRREAFAQYNPVINFIFFIGAVVMGMFFIHPVSAALSALCALAYYIWLKRAGSFKFIVYLAVLFIVLTALNPFFNTQGSLVLFMVFKRPYTLESLLYGATLAGMVVSTLCWFACYNAVMTSDRFIYLFGKILPSVSLTVSMILRLIPNFQRRAERITSARECIGMAGASSDGKIKRLRNGAVVLNTMLAWSLEDGMITADSMLSRGYGSGKRSSFAVYRFDRYNVIIMAVLLITGGATVVFSFLGGMRAEFVPVMRIAWFADPAMLAGHICYLLFMLIPTALNIKEAVVWRILRSRI